MGQRGDDRVPVLYLAPWVDVGGSDKGTIDWFRFLNRDRFRASLITTQPSANRWLGQIEPYADEVWDLPDLMHGDEFARFILTFIHTRGIRVVHIMNSRLGFDLLPQMAGPAGRPRVVVQLHLEEPDASGYVRYVTTRYGNIVDAFSVSSWALSDRLDVYDVPVGKRRVIPTGVDAEREFSPVRVKPRGGLDPGTFHILFPVRITAQKDPLLMVDVAAGLRDRGLSSRVHVLGEGDLESSVRDRVRAAGLEENVILHGTCVDPASWYAACDMVLLTSEFEGVPYALYEGMAMGRPVVAPDLPGIRELVTPDTGVLVSPRTDPKRYVAAVLALASDPSRARAIGIAARAHVRRDLSLERMAADHESLYDELLAAPSQQVLRAADPGGGRAWQPPGAALRSRGPRATPLVSVVVPCFNHGRWLPACLDSIASQTYSPIETIVVDDGSTDPETLEVVAGIAAEGRAIVVRLADNRGPSVARNAGIARARGRYVLPVDADNWLLAEAVATLVEQLRNGNERVGFVYPNYQFFGNRTDYYEPPSYNLDALLAANFCDTCSLVDREVFDRGHRYPEDIVLGHEDWDFVLTLAEHGIQGQPAASATLLYRKHGFTRSDVVETAGVPFADVVARRHPALFDPRTRASLKGAWRPAVTVVALDSIPRRAGDAVSSLVAAAAGQTCQDFEVVVRADRDVWPTELAGRLRRIPTALAASRAEALAQCVAIARGRYVLATYGSPAALLRDRSVIEKLLRLLQANPGIDCVALADGERPLPSFRRLHAEDLTSARLGALCWEAHGPAAPPERLALDGKRPLETLARWLSAHATQQWRHLGRRDRRAVATAAGGPSVAIGTPRYHRARDARLHAEAPPQLPALPVGAPERVRLAGAWSPPQSRLLCRHLNVGTGRFVFTNDSSPPPGCVLHHVLGCVRGLPFPGTTSLCMHEHGAGPSFVLGEEAGIDAPGLLGYVEQAALPLLDGLAVGRHRSTGQRVLVADTDDPLRGAVEDLVSLGYVEPQPIHPRWVAHSGVDYGLAGLVRVLDLGARRHRYGAGRVPRGRLAGELGALFVEPTGDCEPLWIDRDGGVFTDQLPGSNGGPSLGAMARWTGAPLTWRRDVPVAPKMRATARRAYDSARMLISRPASAPSRPAAPAGYLLRGATAATVPLYAGRHPVTGDQLLSIVEPEPRSLGYTNVALLGHLVARAPVTGTLGIVNPGVPWASRFGLAGGER